MKKLFIFAMALVGGVVAFTSCEKGPSNPLVGTWTYQTPVRDGQQNTYTFIFDEKNNFSFEDLYYQYGSFWDGRQQTGTYDIDEAKSIVTLHYTHTKIWGRSPTQESPYEDEEQIKYEIKGDTLNLIRGYGSEYPWEEQYIRNSQTKDDDEDEPEETKTFNATGELRGVMFPVHNGQQQAVITLHPKSNTVDVKFIQARMTSESETPQDIYIYNMPINAGEAHIKLKLEDGSYYTSFSESYAYAILDLEQMTFNVHFGNDDELDTQVYLVYNATLQ
jgi:hypothetical protein